MQEPAHDIAPGDRAPNFVLPDPEGVFRMFYERAKGHPIVLLFYPGRRSPGAWREVEAFVAHQADFAALGIDIFAVSLDDAENNAKLGLPFFVWSDPKGAITAGYLNGAGIAFDPAAPAPDAATTFLLDANQRVLTVRSEAGLAEHALALYRARPPAEAAHRFSATAPFLIVPNVIDRRMCRELIGFWENDTHEEGSVVSVIDGKHVDRVHHGLKKRLDHRIMDLDHNRILQQTIGRRIAPELEKAFYFEGFHFDRFNVVCYDSERGDYFRAHRDNLSPSTANRRFAITVNLNAEEYEGGELIFPEYGPHVYSAGTGDAVLFSCSLIHEALPVTKGRRFALLNFLRGPAKPATQPAPRQGSAIRR